MVNKERGAVLIIVLILSILIVTLGQLCISSGLLQIKMVNNFKNYEASKKNAEKKLIALEKRLANDVTVLEDNVQWVQFVPDTLIFGDKNGTDFYKISVENEEENGAVTHLESTLCLRKPMSFVLYFKHLQNGDHFLSLYESVYKSLKPIFSWEIPKNIEISDPVYMDKFHKVTYVLGSNQILYGINVQGKTAFSVEIHPKQMNFRLDAESSNNRSVYEIHNCCENGEDNNTEDSSEKGIGKDVIKKAKSLPLLVAKELSWFGNNRTIMLGWIPMEQPVIFAMDSYPLSFTDSNNSTLVWYKKLVPGAQAQSLILTRLINGWVGCVSFYENNHSHIWIIDLHSGALIREFIIKGKLTSKMVAIDSKDQGFSDVLYVGDEQGTIWKGFLSDKRPENWALKAYFGLIPGKIVGTPLVGRHPQGQNNLLFLLVEGSANRRNVCAITDTQKNLLRFSSFKANESFKQQMLWQNYLLLQDGEEELVIFDTFTKKFLQRAKIQYELKYAEQNDESMQVLIEKPYDPAPLVVFRTSQGLGFIQAQILSNRLGRKTWVRRH